MNKDKIIITDSGNVSMPSEVRMTIAEISDLFGIFYQTTKREIRTIEKSGIAGGDGSLPCIVDGKNIYSEYYGLEMITALAFRAQSPKADLFRRWVVEKMIRKDVTGILVLSLQNASLN